MRPLPGAAAWACLAAVAPTKARGCTKRWWIPNWQRRLLAAWDQRWTPFCIRFSAVVRHGRSLAEVEAALDAELARLAAAPITQAELDKALKRAKAEFVMAGESITGQTQLLGMAEAVVGDYRWFETVLDRLNAVTLADMERVRQLYLSKANRTVGWYDPSPNGSEAEENEAI